MKVYSLNIIKDKGIIKKNLPEINLIENFGIEKDYNAGKNEYQISFFSQEAKDENSFEEVGFCFSRFVENICTEGLDISEINKGDNLKIGDSILEVTKAGKECYETCPVRKFGINICNASKNIMFAKVNKGGIVRPDDGIEII